jgi:phage gp29-like protein
MAGPSIQRYQQIPVLTNWRETDSVWRLRQILVEHEYGQFMDSAPLWEEMQTDDRIAAVLDTRVGGIVSADLSFVASQEKRKAQKLADLMGGSDQTQDDGLWRRIVSHDAAKEILRWKIGMGVAFGPILWKHIDNTWLPRLVPFNPKYLRYDWGTRSFFVITMQGEQIEMPRTDEEPRGNGNWFFWGGERSWMHGMVRSLAMKYIDRGWNERDRARRSEKYGNAIVEGKHPVDAKADDVNAFQTQLQNLGSEPTIMTPQRDAKNGPSYSLAIHEVKGEGWQVFNDTQRMIDDAIAIRMLGQNLTTDVKGGSLAASKVHEAVRGDVKRGDADLFQCIREQILCWYCHYNLGEAGMAPYPRVKLETSIDPETEANVIKVIGQAANQLRLASPAVDIDALLEANAIPMLEPGEETDEGEQPSVQPVQSTGKGPILTATAQGAIITVNEARAAQGLPPLATDGELTIAEFQAKHAAVIGQAVNAEAGTPDEHAHEEARALTWLSPAMTKLVALKAAPSTIKRRQFYSAARMTKARQMAAQALEPELERLLGVIREAKSLKEIHALILHEAKKPAASVEKLAKLTERLNMLAGLEGRKDALVGALK